MLAEYSRHDDSSGYDAFAENANPKSFQPDVENSDEQIEFGRFIISPGERLLLKGGVSVKIGSRAFDLLVVLVAQKGQTVSKDEIVRYVWPTTMVEECNLRFQMASLRKVLGPDRHLIKTIPGRGYFCSIGQGTSIPTAVRGPRRPDHRPSTRALHQTIQATETGSQVREVQRAEALEGLFYITRSLATAYGSMDAVLKALAEYRPSGVPN